MENSCCSLDLKKIWMVNYNAQFVETVKKYGELIAQGDSKGANKLHNSLQKLYLLMKNKNNLNVFVECLDDEDENIRLWASTFSLSTSEPNAIKELEKLSLSASFTGLSAKMTLELWEKGELEFI